MNNSLIINTTNRPTNQPNNHLFNLKLQPTNQSKKNLNLKINFEFQIKTNKQKTFGLALQHAPLLPGQAVGSLNPQATLATLAANTTASLGHHGNTAATNPGMVPTLTTEMTISNDIIGSTIIRSEEGTKDRTITISGTPEAINLAQYLIATRIYYSTQHYHHHQQQQQSSKSPTTTTTTTTKSIILDIEKQISSFNSGYNYHHHQHHHQQHHVGHQNISYHHHNIYNNHCNLQIQLNKRQQQQQQQQPHQQQPYGTNINGNYLSSSSLPS
ncbi:Poly(rC)-binding protein 3, variant 3 [Dermatophagoides farinae]|uniref:Poly(RC)-binding protein 3, variant 3 n=1 Tax=Dermatophagoides farinae TaxID=6954 RepID=A0A922I5H0_DERFA|nr:Poly(rC)-binding protein 3, variant 3 [Dermatophagoides farinae]